jgi:tetratricopeptide (TPR) repeat protein
MLLDRGLLAREGDAYRPTGPIVTLEVPETLHALIAARLDGLSLEERRLIQDAAVLGKTFTVNGLVSLSSLPPEAVTGLLASLVRKEVLTLQVDPRSPERGQYGFLQDLVKRVAYETLPKKERKAKHLATAAFIAELIGGEEDELVPVVAAHYLDAYRLMPDADDGPDIKARARALLERAGDRAASLAAADEAQRYFEQAAELADDDVSKAESLERAGMAARVAGQSEASIARFEESIKLFESAGSSHPAARVSARLGEVMWDSGRYAEAVERMDRSVQVLSEEELDEDVATLAAHLGRILFFSGRPDLASQRLELALDVAENLALPEVLSQALNTKALILYASKGRHREGMALLRYALDVAVENDLSSASLRAYYNLADLAGQSDHYQDGADLVRGGLELARRVGNRTFEWQFLAQSYCMVQLGEWDEVIAMADAISFEAMRRSRASASVWLFQVPMVLVHRGEVARARDARGVFTEAVDSADIQERCTDAAGEAVVLAAEGHHRAALDMAWRAIEEAKVLATGAEYIKEALVLAMQVAFTLGEPDEVQRVLAVIEGIPSGKLPPYLQAQAMRFEAHLADRRGELAKAEEGLKGAAGAFREMAAPFWMAVVELELAECLSRWGRGDESTQLVAEAREVFERLKATPWVERTDRIARVESAVPS